MPKPGDPLTLPFGIRNRANKKSHALHVRAKNELNNKQPADGELVGNNSFIRFIWDAYTFVESFSDFCLIHRIDCFKSGRKIFKNISKDARSSLFWCYEGICFRAKMELNFSWKYVIHCAFCFFACSS